MTTSVEITGWFMTEQGKPVERRSWGFEACADGEALVEVAGCGVCHTDISFLHQGVKTRAPVPLVLGHEISGHVRAVGKGVDEGLVGRAVVVPAVLPCGVCEACTSGHRTICQKQIMPGNDRHGGFATHAVVPARYLCPVPTAALANNELWQLAVVADAVSTPYMAVQRSGLGAGDFAVVVGAGGIGIYAVQCAAATGAKVLALDVKADKLATAKEFGAAATVNVAGLSEKELRTQVRDAAKSLGARPTRWTIYETSGTAVGQQTAFSLLNHGGYLAVIGFTMDKLELRVSNLMAYDATMRGNWGCDPTLYGAILDAVGAGKIRLGPLTKRFALSEINEVLEMAHHGALRERAVLVP